MTEQMNIAQYLYKFENGDFNNPDRDTQIEAGWYDWFCKDSLLKKKTSKLTEKLLEILPSEKIHVNKHYVWFKNNCPIYGSLYDDFRIADMETGETLYTIVPACGHDKTKGVSSVWGRENDFLGPLTSGKWTDVVDFFKSGKRSDNAIVKEMKEKIKELQSSLLRIQLETLLLCEKHKEKVVDFDGVLSKIEQLIK